MTLPQGIGDEIRRCRPSGGHSPPYVRLLPVGLYGLYGLSRFAWYTGKFFYDDRLVAFDNGATGVYRHGEATPGSASSGR
jgi:hypothetical protein